jgi:hypothetical protein
MFDENDWDPYDGFINLALPMAGRLFGSILGIIALAFFVFLYFAGARETPRDRELASRL